MHDPQHTPARSLRCFAPPPRPPTPATAVRTAARRGRRGAWAGLAGLLWCACGSSSENPRSVELGTGEVRYEVLEGEPELELSAGSQGGFHVWASFLARGFDGTRLSMVLQTTVVDVEGSTLTMRADLATRPFAAEEGAEPDETVRTLAGYPAQIYDARCSHGERARLDIVLTDETGGSASDTRYCILQVPEAFRRDDCE